MKTSIKNILVLVCICSVVSVLLAMTNAVTAPFIAQNEAKKVNKALLEVMPDGKSFEKLDISTYKLPATVSEAYKSENGGYVIKLNTKGYASGMVLMCGVSADGKVTGSKLISSNETPSIGGTASNVMAQNVVGKDDQTVDGVDIISGATKTTAAYRAAIKDALNAAIILGGGDVDIRTEEEILADNLAAALPAGEGKFEAVFRTEVIEGVNKIYKATNGAGYVCVIGEDFIGLDGAGKVLSETSEEKATVSETAVEKLLASKTADLDLAQYQGLPSQLISAQRTETGNYVIRINGAGYGIKGGDKYHPASGTYIEIRVSVTPDGKIIDCLTEFQEETDGFGAACANESFYGQFVGKTEENYDEIDAISGATLTTDGYKEAISRAFNCVKIFEGGAGN